MNKITDINLIENLKKKKRFNDNTKAINIIKTELVNIINYLININIDSKDSKDCKYIESELFIKQNLIKFIELYININRNLININEKTKVVRDILNTLIDDVIMKIENNKNEEMLKIIDLNKEKIKIEKYKNIDLIN